ncbi:VanZ family protein [Jidongwangia harbinensis]|uniref:VanZ family protein n=1 Tax=Jidongwangia harbinensis TaxID=2878561 RepID=UPI001CD9BC28|nr:VanZ family protein [Jidongwangia harbinensis]MCA2213495.1 VanZ family protein [Jidongwangia harbinensis]
MTRRRLLTILLLLCYTAGVAAVTLLPIVPRSPEYWAGEPWWTMFRWVPFDVDMPSFTLNVIMFVPFGILVPSLWPAADTVRRIALRAACASLAIESTQFVLGMTLGSRRTVDVNDLIANTAGALLGLLVLHLALPHAAHRAGLAPAGPRTVAAVRSADRAPTD